MEKDRQQAAEQQDDTARQGIAARTVGFLRNVWNAEAGISVQESADNITTLEQAQRLNRLMYLDKTGAVVWAIGRQVREAEQRFKAEGQDSQHQEEV